MKTKLTNLLGAATLVTGLASVSPALANGTDEQSNPQPCNDVTCPVPGGDVNVDNDVNVDVDVDNTNTNTNTNNNVNNNNVRIRGAASSSAVMVNAGGTCQNGVSVAVGTLDVSAGIGFTTSNYTCMAWNAAVNIFGEGIRSGEKSIQIVALTTLGKLSPEYFGASIEGYAEATGRCGNLAGKGADVVLGANAALGGACPPVKTIVSGYEAHSHKHKPVRYKVDANDISCDVTREALADAREALTRAERQVAKICTPAM